MHAPQIRKAEAGLYAWCDRHLSEDLFEPSAPALLSYALVLSARAIFVVKCSILNSNPKHSANPKPNTRRCRAAANALKALAAHCKGVFSGVGTCLQVLPPLFECVAAATTVVVGSYAKDSDSAVLSASSKADAMSATPVASAGVKPSPELECFRATLVPLRAALARAQRCCGSAAISDMPPQLARALSSAHQPTADLALAQALIRSCWVSAVWCGCSTAWEAQAWLECMRVQRLQCSWHGGVLNGCPRLVGAWLELPVAVVVEGMDDDDDNVTLAVEVR